MEAHEQSISIIGAGKLASHLAFAFKEKGYRFLQVYNRSQTAGVKLASLLFCDAINDIVDLSDQADIYFLTLSDSVIEEFASKLKLNEKLVVIFSGTMDIRSLNQCSLNYGVIYPPQTFSGEQAVSFQNIPLCIEGNNDESTRMLSTLAGSISPRIFQITLEQRRILHVSAVFASNFTNFLYSSAEKLLSDHGLPHDLLSPLVAKTAENFSFKGVFDLQTGPAIREDYAVLKLHEQLLESYPEYQKIYQLLSASIIHQKQQYDQL